MRTHLIFLEKALTGIITTIYTGEVLLLIISGGIQEDEVAAFDSSSIRFMYLLIYIITFSLLILRWRRTLYFLSKGIWIYPLIIFAIFSLFWSFEPATTLKNSFTLVGSSSFGLYFVSRYTLKQQLNFLAWSFGLAIVFSFIFAIALPKYGIMGSLHQGKWRGVFLHKNGLGSIMAYSVILYLIYAVQYKKYRLFFCTFISLAIILMLLASSSSAFANLAVLILTFLFFQIVRFPLLVMFPSLIMGIIISGFFYFLSIENAGSIFASIGKDTTLTGRTELWPLVMDMIWKHPWFGYGYGGFWQGLDGESAYVLRGAGWTFNHPHNGFLSILLDLGFLGLGIFLLGLCRNFFLTLYWIRINKAAIEIFPAISMVFMLITSLTESSLLVSNSLSWILYVSSSIYVTEKLDCIKNKKMSAQLM